MCRLKVKTAIAIRAVNVSLLAGGLAALANLHSGFADAVLESADDRFRVLLSVPGTFQLKSRAAWRGDLGQRISFQVAHDGKGNLDALAIRPEKTGNIRSYFCSVDRQGLRHSFGVFA